MSNAGNRKSTVCKIMSTHRFLLFLLLVSTRILTIFAITNSADLAALNALKSSWKNLPSNWVGADPCGRNWDGIDCANERVTSLILAGLGVEGSQFSDLSSLTALTYLDLSNNIGLKGILPPSIGNLKNLSTLILIGCSFSGPIPDSIGSLKQLVYISLNSNSFNGAIPASIGNLSQLSWLDLSKNKLNGTIPVSTQTAPGLDMLLRARHFHLSNNELSGPIPDRLFSPNMSLIHAIFDNNKLTGNLPVSLGNINNLEVIRFDWNSLDGPIPNLSNLTNLNELYLSNNNFKEDIPNLSGMNFLFYVDMSNNSFNASQVPEWFSSLQSLKTLMMEKTTLQGQIPVDIFKLPQLETVVLSSNNLSGILDIGNSYGSNLTVDLRNNSINDFLQKSDYRLNLTLVGNPICNVNGAASARYCSIEKRSSNLLPSNNCGSKTCGGNKVLSPSCQCANPYTGTLHFFSFAFTDLENATYYGILHGFLMKAFLSQGLPVDSLSFSNPSISVYSYLQIPLQMFPSGQDSFNQTSIPVIGSLLNRQSGFQIDYFGPFVFLADQYCCFGGSKKSHAGLIIGVAVGVSFLVLLVLLAGVYALRQRRNAKRAIEKTNPFASWNTDKESGGAVPQLQGAKWFSFEDLKKCTNNFSEANCIGSGGYGKVYKGTVASHQEVAIKRAQQGSMQGAVEFKTEIELLSRIHHKNVVSLVGFCYEQGEQMLVYEYISNGTLRDSLLGKTGFRLDWDTRLRIALDAARGLSYLHELADPPIIHRDVKSTNILLDNNMNAKVADFGLSKLMGDSGKGYVTTQVKGTLGYMDPEYYMTQQLTEKSDVYSFGVVLLELVSARAPIQHGKHIVRSFQEAIDETIKDPQNNLDQIIDPRLERASNLGGLLKLVELAMSCVREGANERPPMGEVVREIENIIELAKKTTDYNNKLFSSPSFQAMTDESPLHSNMTEGFDVSYGSFPFHVVRK